MISKLIWSFNSQSCRLSKSLSISRKYQVTSTFICDVKLRQEMSHLMTTDVRADLSLRWVHVIFWFCHEAAHTWNLRKLQRYTDLAACILAGNLKDHRTHDFKVPFLVSQLKRHYESLIFTTQRQGSLCPYFFTFVSKSSLAL